MFSETKDFWILAHAFRGPRVLGLWLMFSEDQRLWIVAHVFRDLGFLDLGLCFLRTKGSGSWLMFLEA